MQNTNNISFQDLNLSASMLDALNNKGFTNPSPIQSQIIPLLLTTKKHVIGQAQTGTGKTAAFGIPLVERLDDSVSYTQAIVLTPTRELCLQVCDEIHSLKNTKKLNIVPIYGGQSISLQVTKLKKNPHIIVGTPGRVIDHLDRGTLKIDKVRFFILDEADEMFSMGFQEDVETIMKFSEQSQPQILLFSATFPKIVQKLVKKYIPEHEQVSVTPEQVTTKLVEQKYYAVSGYQKFNALTRIIDITEDFYGIIFCQTKVMVQETAQKLIEHGYKAADIHGDLSQHQREIALKKFKKHSINMLVATDVAARGIDVQDLNYVVNYSLPQDPEAYVHRIGRTGRAGKKGIAISLVSHSEFPQLLQIQRITHSTIEKAALPSPEDLIEKRAERLIENISKTAQSTELFNTTYITKIAETLLARSSSEKELIELLLKHFAGKTLIPEQYNRIPEEDFSNQSKGNQKIFIALGKIQGTNKDTIIDLLAEKGQVPKSDIDDIIILENFSFATIPNIYAQAIVKDEKRRATRNKKPLITLAKAKDSSSRGGRGLSRDRNSGGFSRDRNRNNSGGNWDRGRRSFSSEKRSY